MKNIKLFEEFANESKILLTANGQDDFSRTLYKGNNGKKYVDVDGVPHTMSREGEPESPLRLEYEIKGTPSNPAAKHNYMMLSRLQQDCEYFLGNGNRSEKNLWAGNVDAQIKEMKRLWNILQEKPEWLSMEEILDYEEKMKATK